MNRLDRYVGRTVLVAILLVLAIIVGLDAFAAILNEAVIAISSPIKPRRDQCR